jgi:hypothetical protein
VAAIMMMVEQKRYESFLRLRQALAWPLYAVSVVLDFASVALGRLATWIAGDDWPG